MRAQTKTYNPLPACTLQHKKGTQTKLFVESSLETMRSRVVLRRGSGLTFGVLEIVSVLSIHSIQVLHRRLGEHQLVSIQNIKQVQGPGRQHLQRSDVPAAQHHIIRDLRHKEGGFILGIQPPPPHRSYELLGPGALLERLLELLHHERVLGGGGAGDGGGDGEALLLAVDLDGPVLGLGAEDDPPRAARAVRWTARGRGRFFFC
ncbi:uncharacterized protein A4U43_C08F36400 [Asparagus officinalis]|nr:uncharacterized protein A4U43_C08F36400 [Asparagus officinalis]